MKKLLFVVGLVALYLISLTYGPALMRALGQMLSQIITWSFWTIVITSSAGWMMFLFILAIRAKNSANFRYKNGSPNPDPNVDQSAPNVTYRFFTWLVVATCAVSVFAVCFWAGYWVTEQIEGWLSGLAKAIVTKEKLATLKPVQLPWICWVTVGAIFSSVAWIYLNKRFWIKPEAFDIFTITDPVLKILEPYTVGLNPVVPWAILEQDNKRTIMSRPCDFSIEAYASDGPGFTISGKLRWSVDPRRIITNLEVKAEEVDGEFRVTVEGVASAIMLARNSEDIKRDLDGIRARIASSFESSTAGESSTKHPIEVKFGVDIEAVIIGAIVPNKATQEAWAKKIEAGKLREAAELLTRPSETGTPGLSMKEAVEAVQIGSKQIKKDITEVRGLEGSGALGGVVLALLKKFGIEPPKKGGGTK